MTKIYNAWAKKVKRSYISGICFHQKRTKLLKLGLSLNLFMQNRKCITSKIAGQLCVMTMKNDANWIDLPVQNWHEKFNNFNWNLRNLILTRALEHLKKLHLNGLLLTKVYKFRLKKYKRDLFDGIQDWYRIWKKTDLWFQKWHEEFSPVRKSKNWDFDGVL